VRQEQLVQLVQLAHKEQTLTLLEQLQQLATCQRLVTQSMMRTSLMQMVIFTSGTATLGMMLVKLLDQQVQQVRLVQQVRQVQLVQQVQQVLTQQSLAQQVQLVQQVQQGLKVVQPAQQVQQALQVLQVNKETAPVFNTVLRQALL
jgi:hypothetical protein